MSLPTIVSYGAAAKTSSLVWDGDLIIPDGYAIESASGEVGIVGDVSVSGNLVADGNVTAGVKLVSVNAVISDKQLVVSDTNYCASVTLAQIPKSDLKSYTSPDFAITGAIDGVQYIVPPVTYNVDSNSYDTTTTFSIQAKLASGSYQTISSGSVYTNPGVGTITTKPGITPAGTTAVRYVVSTNGNFRSQSISSDLSLIITALPVYTQAVD